MFDISIYNFHSIIVVKCSSFDQHFLRQFDTINNYSRWSRVKFPIRLELNSISLRTPQKDYINNFNTLLKSFVQVHISYKLDDVNVQDEMYQTKSY